MHSRTHMSMSNRLARYGGMRLSKRLRGSVPVIGAAIAVATIVSTVRRKGLVSGSLDTGLNAMPFVGAVKNVIEMMRGRDFFPDRQAATAGAPARRVSAR